MPTPYTERVHDLSQRIVAAQKPIRILDAIKWDDSVEKQLRKSKFKDLPDLGAAYYARNDLRFDPKAKLEELSAISSDVQKLLGDADDVGKLLSSICEEYRLAVEMLQARGTPRFGELSRKLYGSPGDRFMDDKNTIESLGLLLSEILDGLKTGFEEFPKVVEAQDVVKQLNERFANYFGKGQVDAKLSDGILADAAAGGDSVKIKQGAFFSPRDIDVLEVHEGWVHVATTLNGKAQRLATWLSKGPPRIASTQEGLAVILEIFTFRTYPRRARAITDRIVAISKAEQGANILEIIEFYRQRGHSEDDAIYHAERVFRGGPAEGGAPFTKDISYCKGFIENYNFLRAAVRAGRPELIPFLFVGKLHVDDVPLLYRKHLEGLVDAPKHVPPQFKDFNGLAVWMAFSSFLNRLDMSRIQGHYDKLFRHYGAG